MEMITLSNWIGGERVPPVSGEYMEGFEPATGKPYSRVPSSDEADVNRAVESAERAFSAWSARPATERARILRRMAAGIESRLEAFARAEAVDSGKPLSVARTVDIPRAALNFEFFADAATQFSSEAHVTDTRWVNYTVRAPLGVVACISPWNLPLYLLTWKIAPALAAGCCVVAKPSEVTPMTAHLLSEVCVEAGLPPGVLNIVHGLGSRVGAALVAHPRVKAISFTGSTRTGAEIARVASPQFKKLSLELGGKNAFIVFEDADYEQALNEAVRAGFSNQGQICLCGSRLYVQSGIYEKFKRDFVARVKSLRQGDPMDTETQQGAVVSREHFEKVMACIELARREGGQILAGGAAARLSGRCSHGWFIEPTVIEDLPEICRTNQEEIFGPVVTIAPFDTDEEVLAYANGTRYGLAASLWTESVTRAHAFSARLQSGIVWVNCWMKRDLRTPFGGVKESGVGREGGWEAMRFFTEPKNICIELRHT